MNNSARSNKIHRGGVPIGRRVKRALDDEFNQIIFVALCVGLILMIVILYKYTYGQVTQRAINDVDKLRASDSRLAKLRLKQLDKCQQQNSQHQYRLCDYYIASSYNTACTGQQHFGYVSDDMIAKALKNGARFIHLKVAADSSNRNTAKPVVCTAIGQRITSMNTIPFREAVLTIQQNAFTYERTLTTDGTDLAPVNYPLFVYLDLHTPYESVLDQIAHNITTILGHRTGALLNASQYQSRPIALTPLCELLNQIVILASPGYENSQALSDLIVPMDSMHMARVTDYERIMNLNNSDNSEIDSRGGIVAESKISAIDRHQAISKLTPKLASGGKLASSSLANLDDIIGDDQVLRHMFGLSIVFPVRRPEDEQITTTTNPDPIPIMQQGAQFICMHYQLTDENMRLYLDLFLHKYNSSFILKPSGMRLPPSASDLTNALNGYSTNNVAATLASNPTGFQGAEPMDSNMVKSELVDRYWRIHSSNNMELLEYGGNLKASRIISANIRSTSSTSGGSGVFQIQEHPLSSTDVCLVMLVTLDGKQAISAGNGERPILQHLNKINDNMAFYLEHVPSNDTNAAIISDVDSSGNIDSNSSVKLFRVFSRRVPTYLALDQATQQPILLTMSSASNDNLGFGVVMGGSTSTITSAAMELKEAVVRQRIQIWIQHPQLGTRFVAVFNGSQIGLTASANKQSVFELRRVTEDGMVAIVLPESKPVGKLVVNESSSGQAKVVPYGEHSKNGRKWQFLLLKQFGGRVYLDDEDGYRLGAMDDGRLRWRASWPLDSAVSEFYIKETAMEVISG